MNYNTMTTVELFILLGSRSCRLEAWDRRQRYSNLPRARSEYSESDDNGVVVDVSAELAKRIDAGRKEQP